MQARVDLREIRQLRQIRAHLFKIHSYGHCTRAKAQVTGDGDAIFAGHRDDRATIVIHDRLHSNG